MENYIQQQLHLLPYVFSADVLLKVEAEAALKRLSGRLATYCKQPFSRICGYMNSRVAITMVGAMQQFIR